MSKIPYFFQTPVPKYFREKGFFKDPKNCAFVTWAFERCSNEKRSIQYNNQIITLNPFQFIFGRRICSEETGLTEDEVRTQQKRWEDNGFLKKAPNKTPNRFTIYEWVLTSFLKNDHQVKPRPTPNQPPTNPHNLEYKNIRIKEDHPLTPSFQKKESDEMKDDFFQKKRSLFLLLEKGKK